jgi:hypothetical protein
MEPRKKKKKTAFIKKKIIFARKLHLNLSKTLVKCSIWGRVLHGAETWTLQKVDQNGPKRF